MATTAVTSTSTATTTASTAQATQAAKRASAQSIITALSAGSGVDVAALAQGLVDAEKLPQEQQINSKISKSEARVSGYAAVSFMLKTMNDSLIALKDANSFDASSVSNSNTSAMGVTTSTGAAIGSHSVSITSLASAQRNISTAFAASSTALNAGSSFTMDLTIGTDAVAATSTSTAAVSGLTINGTAIDAVSADPTVVTASGSASATPVSTFVVGSASKSTETVVFSALAAGQAATVNGLTFTATSAMTAIQVGAAFSAVLTAETAAEVTARNTVSAALGTYTGTNTAGYASAATTTATAVYTSVADNAATFAVAPSSTAVAETSVVTFGALAAGQKATVNGLTFTATAAMTSAQVASAFSSLTSGMLAATATSTNTTSAALGTYSGTFTAGFTTGALSGSTVTATSTTSANVTDIAITARKFDNLAIAINAKTSTTGVTAVNTSGSVALTGASINLGTTANSTKAITGISSTVTVTVAAGYDTPQGLVDAINDADLAVTARLVNTGSTSSPSYKVVFSGAEGSDGAFSMSTTPATVLTALNFTETAAVDAVLTVDGVSYTRTSNTVTDAIEGVTLTLNSTTTTAASVNLTRDTTAIKTKINDLVTAYNDVNNILTEVSNSKSTLDTYGATLVGDSVVRQVRSQLREMLLGQSSSPGTNVSALWQMGLSIDRTGVMTLNSTKLDAALTSNFKDVVTTFTGNQNNRSATSPPFSTSAGYASATTSINADAAFSVSLVNGSGTFVVPIAVGSTTPQGVVDAINASSQGFSAQLVQDSTGTAPYKIMVMGSTGSSGFTISATDAVGTAVTGLTFAANGAGIAGDAFRKISALLAPDGALLTQTATATTQADKLKATLEVLQTRMEALLARYTKQFAAMESLVGNINSQKTSLKTSFDGMMSIYTNQ
ncbi:MAG: flagellar filament capping protein FliD [Polaromonas sp.]|nr:flagellar filament capping protein FliD [Polaromonas sp.]